ncbi:winged helix-turn-helix domain-containing protein [Lewinella sp. LCG006]|uniref:winged helix-turn-helix domain-containing protein n=1 Tax=Lewinella sp. LCG006 TaxID=3231911 RepID=UPI00345F947D
MKELITHLRKAFDHRVRLGVMSMLMVTDWVDFTHLRDHLEISDGNLASHLKALDKEGYVELRKQFIGRRPNTSYRVTEKGRVAFLDHLAYLEKIINLQKEDEE